MYYFKGGGFVPGVPARHLSNADAKEYGVEESPLYSQDEIEALIWEIDNELQGDEPEPGTENHETDEEVETRLASEGVDSNG